MLATLTIDQLWIDQSDWSVDRTEDAPMNLRVFTGDDGNNGSESVRTNSTLNSRARSRERMRSGRKAVGTSFLPVSPRTRATLRTAGVNSPAVLTPELSKPSPCVVVDGAEPSATAQPMTPVADVRSIVASEIAKVFASFLPAQAPPVVAPEVRAIPSESLVELYEKHMVPGEMVRNEPRTVRADVARVLRFQEWLDSCALRSGTPQRASLVSFTESKTVLFDYARFIRSKESGASTCTVTQALNAIMKLARWAVDVGSLEKLPKYPTKGDINEMRLDGDREFQGEPVTIPEFKLMMSPAVLADCEWPLFGDIPPAVFWETVLVAHIVFGFRSQDWFAARTSEKTGLMWADIITDTKCPRLDDLHNPYGWAWYLVHKTKKKARRAGKPVNSLVPFPKRLRELIEMFRGVHPERVFPLTCNGRYWTREFNGILERSGLDDLSRKAAHKPVIELSLGQSDVASFRKGCAAMWTDEVSGAAASYMLKHSVTDDKDKDGPVSNVTREHYLQIYRPLRKIVPALEKLPVWECN